VEIEEGDDMEDRLIELETRLTYQDDLLQKLDEVVIMQQREIDALKLQVRHISDQLRNVSPEGSMGEEPPPPHY
jgi:SlyX protein